MKPKTKLQHRVIELSKQLPLLTEEQKQWGITHCLSHLAHRTKHQTNCLDCGHSWKTSDNTRLLARIVEKDVICPACGMKLEVKDTRERVTAGREFFTIIDKAEELQVIRIFEIRAKFKIGKPKDVHHFIEVVQEWLVPGSSKWEVVARLRGGMGYWNDSFNGYLEIRGKQSFEHKWNIYPTKVWPKIYVHGIYKRNGFTGKYYNLTPYDILYQIGIDNRCETLLKTKQHSLLEAMITGKGTRIVQYWAQVRIAMRHNYIVKNAGDWVDHIELLTYFKKDICNPKFICPEDFLYEHDVLVEKKSLIEVGREVAKDPKAIERKNRLYTLAKSKYFGLTFQHKNMTIKVLESIEDFIAEYMAHKHCIYTNEHYKKVNSLCFSAQVNGKRVETVEVSLERLSVSQSQGLNHKHTQYHDQIKELVMKNMKVIKQIRDGKEVKQKISVAA